MINKHIEDHHIDLKLGEELEEIITDQEGNASAVRLKNGESIICQFVGLTVGVHPNIGFLKGTELETDKGVLINEYLETNLPDVYALGDCAQHKQAPEGRRPVEQIWYTGKIMGETVAKTICGNRTEYEPGIFYNSAKFLDIEYQTYGSVPANKPENLASFVWQHESKNLLVRINFNKESGAVTGVNTFGIRMRHEIWDQWIANKTPIEKVLIDLSKANFDPELFKRYESEIVQAYNLQFSKNIKLKTKKTGLAAIFG